MPSRHQNKKSNKRSRKAKAGKSKKSRSRRNRSKSSQKGGNASGACVLDYSNKNNMFNADANAHNSNPQASLDLDNKFLSYAGPVPLGSSIVGGGSCGSEGVGTSNPKSDTFKEYMTRLDENLSSVTGGNPNSNPKPNSKPNVKTGGGYSYDPNEFIGGQPVVKSWDDNSPPAIVGGQLVFGSPDQPICGNGAVSGGFRRNKNSSKKRSKKNSKKTKRSKNKNMKSSKQRGGDFTTFNNSKPAEYDQAFNGPPGVFQYPDNMMSRTFEGRQPEWNPTTV
jgi:hypothetical protein